MGGEKLEDTHTNNTEFYLLESLSVEPTALHSVDRLILIQNRHFLFAFCSLITGMFVSASGGAVWPALVSGLLGEANLSNSIGFMNFVGTIGNVSGPPIAGIDIIDTLFYNQPTEAGKIKLYIAALLAFEEAQTS